MMGRCPSCSAVLKVLEISVDEARQSGFFVAGTEGVNEADLRFRAAACLKCDRIVGVSLVHTTTGEVAHGFLADAGRG
jgi:hypothetical protein